MREQQNDNVAKLGIYSSLDAWRGFACLAVVFHHALPTLAGKYPVIGQSPLEMFTQFGYLGVHLFFVISGFCIAHAAISLRLRGKTTWDYVVARVRRIFPTYYFALPAFAVMQMGATYLIAKGMAKQGDNPYFNLLQASPLTWFANLTLTQEPLRAPYVIGVAWTLCYEVAFYAIIALGLVFTRRVSALFFFSHTLTVACLVYLCAFPHNAIFPFDLWAQFGFGFLVYDFLRGPNRAAIRTWALAICALLLVLVTRLLLLEGNEAFKEKSDFLSYVVAGLFSAAILALHRHDKAIASKKVVSFFTWLGIFSYSIYLTHTFILTTFSVGAKAVRFPNNELLLHVLMLATVATSIAAARLFYHFCERPFMKSSTRPAANTAMADGPEQVLASSSG